MYREVDGDLIELALSGEFDVIAHGCNCFCTMGAGIALPMANTFDCNNFPLENIKYKGDINKLGQIDYKEYSEGLFGKLVRTDLRGDNVFNLNNYSTKLVVVNAYTQYKPGPNLDLAALTLCLRKINHMFCGMKVGLPKIGSGLAGGDWNMIKQIIIKELKDCDVTVVNYKK